jgi:beta-lactamase class A
MHPSMRAVLGAAILLTSVACAEVSGDAQPPAVLLGTPQPAPADPVDPEGRPGAAVLAASLEPVSLEGLVRDVEVPPLPLPFASAVHDAGLQGVIEGAVAGLEGSYSVVVHNLADGRSAAVNPDHVYYAASVYKLSVLREAFLRRDAGELDFTTMVTLEPEFAEYDSGTMEPLGLAAGDRLTVLDSLRAMIVVSDTPNAVLLQRMLGSAPINEHLRALGIENTDFNNHDLPTTAADMASLVSAIASGEGVPEVSRLEMLALLLQERFTQGIIAGVPDGTAVAHKTGAADNATHDVGIVWGPAGPYVISVFSDAFYAWEPIAAISRAAYDYFAQ